MSKKILSFSALIFATFLFTLVCSNGQHNTLSLTTEEVHYLKALKKPIIVAPCPDYPPIDFTGSDGHFTGLTHDYLHEIAKKLGITFTVANISSWAHVLQAAKEKKVDIVLSIQDVPERHSYLHFTKPYVKIPNVIVVRKSENRNFTVQDLRGLHVAVVKGYAVVDDIMKRYPSITFKFDFVTNETEGLMKLAFGEYDAMVISLSTVSYLIDTYSITNLRVAGTVGYDWNLCIGVRSDNPVLYSVIAKALNSLPKTKLDEMYRKWISLAPRPVYYEIQFWYIIASILLGVSIIILVIIGWNTSLRKQVAIKTQQLENELQLHKKTQEQLLLEKERLFITIQSIGDIFIITDNEGNVILANKQAETVFGKAVVSGGCLYSSITFIEPNAQHTVNPIDACMQSGNVTTFYHCICRYDDRSIDVSVVSSPIIIEDTVTGVVTIMRDISTMLAMQNELIKLQQFESLGILAAGIAHDFNNILMAIMGNTELLGAVLKNTGNVSDSTRITDGIKKSVKSAQSLTAQLLTYAKGGKPIKQSGNIVQLLNDTVDFMASGTGIKINYSIDSYDYEFDFDENQLSHVFRNLTLNAVQAMGNRGVLTIKVLEEGMDNANTIQLPAGNYVKIQFIDTGNGIPPAHVNKIFDPYFTTKEKGSGLGLTTSLSIVKQHGGTMTVSSSHEGTTFSVYLPKVKQGQVYDTAMAHEVASPNAVVLVIDDRQDIIEVTTGMLDILGYSYDWAYSGNEAIAKLVEGKNKKHLFDCVLVDVTIPGGMSGVEAFTKMKTIQPLLKGIVMSGYADNNAIAEYERYGFSWYLVKPFTLSDLKLALLKALL